MGLQQIVPGVFSEYFDIVAYPVMDSLSFLHYLGKDEASSAINHAVGFPPATTVGANVTFAPTHAVFSGNLTLQENYMTLPEADNASTSLTLMCVHRHTGTGLKSDQGTIGAGSRGVNGLIMTSAGGMVQSNAGASVLDFPSVALPETTPPRMLFTAVTYEALTGEFKAYRCEDGKVRVAAVSTAVPRVLSSATYRVGGGYSATVNGENHIAMASKHRKALSVQEIAFIYDYFRFRGERVGLSVG